MKSNVLVLIPVVSAVKRRRNARTNETQRRRCKNTQVQMTAELDYNNGELIKHYFHNDPYQLLSHLSGSGAAAQQTIIDGMQARVCARETFVLLSPVVSAPSREQSYKKQLTSQVVIPHQH